MSPSDVGWIFQSSTAAANDCAACFKQKSQRVFTAPVVLGIAVNEIDLISNIMFLF
jgi:hypothetical protein